MSDTKKIQFFILLSAFGLGIFLAFFKLTESPPLWLDEGVITQVAITIKEHLVYGIQTAPEQFVSGGFITTGYPVTYPISIAMELFGVGLLPARIVMALFIILCIVAGYLLIEKSFGKPWSYFAICLIVSFAPLYGNGKSVLGEVPGISFLFLSLLFLVLAKGRRHFLIFSGLFAGLCIATKPIFLLLIPSVVIAFLIHRKQFVLQSRNVLAYIIASLIPLSIWAFLQFSHDSLGHVFEHYANPYGISLAETFITNFKQFFTEFQPLYFLGMLVLWGVSYSIRKKKKETIDCTESIAIVFSFLIFLDYFRIEGHYRYFFPGQIVALLYLPNTLKTFEVNLKRKYIYILLSGLIIFQLYVTFFHSWVATYYGSVRTENLKTVIQSLPKDESIFIYQVPQAVVFLESRPYYQYVEITKKIVLGESELSLLSQGKISSVLIPKEQYDTLKQTLLSKYEVNRSFDSLVLLTKKI